MKIADVCGYKLAAVTRPECVRLLRERADAGVNTWLVTLNLEMVARGRRTPEYKELIQQADLTIADGWPVVWASTKKHSEPDLPERVTGIDLSTDLLRAFPPEHIAILGGEDPILALEAIQLEGKEKVLIDNGRFSDDDAFLDLLAEKLDDRKLIFIALGVPKQDKIAIGLRKRLPGRILIGVGGTFELMSGTKKRAPQWVQKIGMEWMFRLLLEPKRLWRRYLIEYWGGGFALLKDIRRSAALVKSKSDS